MGISQRDYKNHYHYGNVFNLDTLGGRLERQAEFP
jgi:hypothetical protein